VTFFFFFFFFFQSLYISDRHSRKWLHLPTPDNVDFRAACFCHKNVIDIGYVCSVCLSSNTNVHFAWWLAPPNNLFSFSPSSLLQQSRRSMLDLQDKIFASPCDIWERKWKIEHSEKQTNKKSLFGSEGWHTALSYFRCLNIGGLLHLLAPPS